MQKESRGRSGSVQAHSLGVICARPSARISRCVLADPERHRRARWRGEHVVFAPARSPSRARGGGHEFGLEPFHLGIENRQFSGTMRMLPPSLLDDTQDAFSIRNSSADGCDCGTDSPPASHYTQSGSRPPQTLIQKCVVLVLRERLVEATDCFVTRRRSAVMKRQLSSCSRWRRWDAEQYGSRPSASLGAAQEPRVRRHDVDIRPRLRIATCDSQVSRGRARRRSRWRC